MFRKVETHSISYYEVEQLLQENFPDVFDKKYSLIADKEWHNDSTQELCFSGKIPLEEAEKNFLEAVKDMKRSRYYVYPVEDALNLLAARRVLPPEVIKQASFQVDVAW
jgi:hypothetical protein